MKLEPVHENERVITKLPDSLKISMHEIDDLMSECEAMFKRWNRAAGVARAKHTLFMDALMNVSEQAETAADRGCYLGIRKDEDGEAVIVEFKMAQEDIAAAANNIIVMLRRMMGQKDEEETS